MTFRISQQSARALFLAGLGIALSVAACEPMFRPATFSDFVFTDEGEREAEKNAAGEERLDDNGSVIYKTKEVAEIKYAEGTQTVSAEVLNKGREVYRAHCVSCHGINGDGQGWSAKGLLPPPRNFSESFAVFKFAHVQANAIPADEDLKRTIRNGLHGTAMLPWKLSEDRLDWVVQYVKHFSKRFRDEKPGEPVAAAPDPFGPSKQAEAIAKGEKLFHLNFQCAQCHPNYISQAKINEYLKADGQPEKTARPDAFWSVAKPSDSYKVNITPPDFTWHDLRSIRKLTDGSAEERNGRREDLYFAIATGIGGTAMPTWKDAKVATRDTDIWAVVYYVETLIDLRNDGAKRQAFWSKLR